MIEIIKGLPKNVVGIAVEGRVTEKDCQDVLMPAINFRVLRGTISTSGSSMFRRASGSQL